MNNNEPKTYEKDSFVGRTQVITVNGEEWYDLQLSIKSHIRLPLPKPSELWRVKMEAERLALLHMLGAIEKELGEDDDE